MNTEDAFNPPHPEVMPRGPVIAGETQTPGASKQQQILAVAVNRALVAEHNFGMCSRRLMYLGVVVLPLILVGGIVLGKFFL